MSCELVQPAGQFSELLALDECKGIVLVYLVCEEDRCQGVEDRLLILHTLLIRQRLQSGNAITAVAAKRF